MASHDPLTENHGAGLLSSAGVKRDSALIPLSRDHHQALFAAQQLRRAGEDTAASARDAFLGFWRERGRAHFRAEEEVLLPAYAGHGDPHHPLVARALCEHAVIRHRADALAGGAAAAVDDLHELARLLDDHVRLEERELFPLIEAALPQEDLAALGAALEQAERGAGT